jgi:ABC-type multidrug transport system fused ATPase/permease subunit
MKTAAARELGGYTAVFQTLSETIGGLRIVKIFTRERSERRRFKLNSLSLYGMAMRITFYDSVLRPVTELMAITTMVIAVLVGAYLVLNQQTHLFGVRMSAQPLKPSEMIMFFAMLAGVSDPARKLGDIYNVLVRACMGGTMISNMFEQRPRVCAPPEPVPAPMHTDSIRLDKVVFGYQPKMPVLREVTLEIPFGQTVALVGTNGCGKSTLVNLIARFYDPWSGHVFLDGVNLRDIRPRQLRMQIGIVTQDPYLFRDTIRNNIRYGNPAATGDQVVQAAELAGVTRFVDELPRGLETSVGDRGNALSGGQRQRVALARAALSDPRILILDEPTSQVDPQTEQILQQAIAKFLKGRTTFLITHKASTLALADRIVVMKQGRIVDDVLVTPATSSAEHLSSILSKAA